MERLQKIIAKAGIASRRKAEILIAEGHIQVDGVTITEMGFIVKKGSKVTYNGKSLMGENKVYYVLHKPKRVISTVNDEKQRKTVLDFIDTTERIFPIGRLDYDTSGVLLLTNDGDFANELTHPRYHIDKTYEVKIDGILKTEEIKQLERGVSLDEVMTLPAKVWITNKDFAKKETEFEITIEEGKNRQIKRMCETYGYTVLRLHRKRFAFVEVTDLKVGEYRRLKPFEVKQLRKLANEGKLK